MKGKLYYMPLTAAFLFYGLSILVGYASGYPELASAGHFAGFILYTVGVKFLFIVVLAMSAFGYGGAVFGRWLPAFGTALDEGLFKVSLGLILISYAVFLAGVAGLLYPVAAYFVLAAGLAVGARGITLYLKRLADAPRDFRLTLTSVILSSLSAFFLIRGLYGALMPPTGFDVLMYHLGVPRMYVDAHSIFPTPDINGSYFPYGVEMLYTLGMMVDNVISANMVNYSFAIAGGLAAAAFTRRFFGPGYGLLAFTIYVSVPMVQWLMPQAYVELGLAAYTALAVYALIVSFKENDRGWFVVGAVLSGFTLAIKYTAGVTVFVMLLLLLFQLLYVQRSGAGKAVRYGGVFLAVCAAVSAVWYMRNIYYFGNPVYPLLAGVFGGGNTIFTGTTSPFVQSGASGRLGWLAGSLWRTTLGAQEFQSGWANGLGPVFLMFLPGLAMFKGYGREMKYLMGFCLTSFLILVWAGNIRYILPVMPGLAVLASYPAGRLLGEEKMPLRAAGAALVALFAFSALLANTGRDRLDGFPSASPAAMDRYYSEEIPSGYMASYDTWKWIDANLPEGAVIYQLWDDASVYFRHRKTVGFPLSWGETGRQKIHYIQGTVGFGGFLPGEEIIDNLRGMGAGYLLVNANREGHQVPDDPYFQAHARLVLQDKGVFLFQITP